MPPCAKHAAGRPLSQLLVVRDEAHAVQLLLYNSWSTSFIRARLKRGRTPSMPPSEKHAAGWSSSQHLVVRDEAHAVQLLLYSA